MYAGLPPSRMSVPRPAMLVEMVTAAGRRLRDDLGLALRRLGLGVEHLQWSGGEGARAE